MYLEKIKVEKDDTILVHFDEDNCDTDRVMEYLRCIEKLYPHNTIIPIIPKYGIEKFETKSEFTGNPYAIETSSEC